LVYAIVPVHERQLAGICFGDHDMQTLYVSTGTEIYTRKVQAVGVPQQSISVG
jgi:sugar lactone lactonase YvrE